MPLNGRYIFKTDKSWQIAKMVHLTAEASSGRSVSKVNVFYNLNKVCNGKRFGKDMTSFLMLNPRYV